ncbi:hypothetical protein M422DRAFT_53714 [Sphaerobolus stellatus SS14]|uniref:Uncharacterized protein n=1 Tax=Sphaerobolus stellatus (strain SS14) TaxID=990650 RepID=A0A0C9UZI2_SPHS4|nr:hypothetical protein M422DRAFT_53714 [Sphaerobolus stellatus SS14]
MGYSGTARLAWGLIIPRTKFCTLYNIFEEHHTIEGISDPASDQEGAKNQRTKPKSQLLLTTDEAEWFMEYISTVIGHQPFGIADRDELLYPRRWKEGTGTFAIYYKPEGRYAIDNNEKAYYTAETCSGYLVHYLGINVNFEAYFYSQDQYSGRGAVAFGPGKLVEPSGGRDYQGAFEKLCKSLHLGEAGIQVIQQWIMTVENSC